MHLIVELVADFVIDYLVGFYFDAICGWLGNRTLNLLSGGRYRGSRDLLESIVGLTVSVVVVAATIVAVVLIV